jgi:hypothetical protein
MALHGARHALKFGADSAVTLHAGATGYPRDTLEIPIRRIFSFAIYELKFSAINAVFSVLIVLTLRCTHHVSR